MESETIISKFRHEQEEKEYADWIKSKEFEARRAIEQKYPLHEIEFLTRYVSEQNREFQSQIDGHRKAAEKSLKEHRDAVDKAISQAVSEAIGKNDPSDRLKGLRAEIDKAMTAEARKVDLKLGKIASSVEAAFVGLESRVKAIEKQPRVVQQVVPPPPAPPKKPKAWKFDVVEMQDGMIRTVLASADGEAKFRIDFNRSGGKMSLSMTGV